MIKDNSVYLKHILESIAHIEQFLDEIDHNETIFAENYIGKMLLSENSRLSVKPQTNWTKSF